MRAAVQVGSKLDAALFYLAALRKAEDMITAAVGENRFVPADELMKPAATCDQLIARAQHQVIRIAEDDAGANLSKVLRSQGLNGALGADRHEHGCLDLAVCRPQDPAPRAAVSVGEREQKDPRPLIIVE